MNYINQNKEESYSRKKYERMLRAALCTALLLLLLSASAASAATITVDDSGGADYTSIQAAMDAASEGDTIEVRSGTYVENVDVGKRLTLRGVDTGAGMPVVDGGGSGNGNVVEVTVDRVVIDGFTIQNGLSGIHVISSNNVFSNNLITNIIGANGVSDGDGGIGSGIYFSGSTNNTLTFNTISNITGGIGGSGDYTSGVGGLGSGIYLSGSTDITLFSNTISNISGGIGGLGEYASGVGGLGSGIYLSGSTNNTFTSNTISNITGGASGWGRYDYTSNTGGTGFGIYFSSSINNTLTSNTISNITGGTSGTSGESLFDRTGDTGGIGFGIYFLDSINNTLFSNTICNITGGTGGLGIGFGSGGDGGIGSGICLSSSTNNTLFSNTISNIIGGTGGRGFDDGSGGDGGIGSGICLSSSTNNTLSSNTISNIIGGIGGTGGDLYSSSVDGIGYSIYLYTSTLNMLFHNNLQNDDMNGYDDGSNSWDNGYPSGGNYWSDYTGIDDNTDGIGDTPYNISGSVGAQDRYPLMEPWNGITDPGSISGVVSYSYVGGGPINGVTVDLKQGGVVIDTTATNALGEYSLVDVSPGTYDIEFSKLYFYDEIDSANVVAGINTVVNINLRIKGDLDNNGQQADAVDVNMMMQASVGDIPSDRYFDLDNNEQQADAVDVNMMIQASVGDIILNSLEMASVNLPKESLLMADYFGVSNASGLKSSTLSVPFEIVDAANGPLQTIKFSIDYDESLISLKSVDHGSLTSDWIVTLGKDKHSITMTTFDNTNTIPDGSTGIAGYLNFKVVGKFGDTTSISLNGIDFSNINNEHGVALTEKEGIFSITQRGKWKVDSKK